MNQNLMDRDSKPLPYARKDENNAKKVSTAGNNRLHSLNQQNDFGSKLTTAAGKPVKSRKINENQNNNAAVT